MGCAVVCKLWHLYDITGAQRELELNIWLFSPICKVVQVFSHSNNKLTYSCHTTTIEHGNVQLPDMVCGDIIIYILYEYKIFEGGLFFVEQFSPSKIYTHKL